MTKIGTTAAFVILEDRKDKTIFWSLNPNVYDEELYRFLGAASTQEAAETACAEALLVRIQKQKMVSPTEPLYETLVQIKERLTPAINAKLSGFKWVSVRDELPKGIEDVLVYWNSPEAEPPTGMAVAYLEAGDSPAWCMSPGFGKQVDYVTHWMPLPEDPS